MHNLDHILWEEIRLEDGERRFTEMTGVAPAFGGVHPHADTHNSLLSLGNTYLEIISLTPDRLKAAHLSTEKLAAFRPGLMSFGVRADDLTYVETLVKEVGLSLSSSHEVSRRSPEGDLLTWQTIVVGGHGFGHLMPFFTRCGEMVHPSETALKGCELLEFSALHPNSEELSRLFKALEVNVAVAHAEHPQLRAVLETPKGRVTLLSR